MRIIIALIIVVSLLQVIPACKSSSPQTFCDTSSCLKDSIKFIQEDNPLRPYVYISPKDCNGDTLIWSAGGYEVNRKMGLMDLLGTTIQVRKDYVSAFIKDTSYAWVLLNDCVTGRGFQLQLPFSKNGKLVSRSSGLNATDPKFFVAKGLLAYSDRGNLFVEDMATGKQAMMTFGKRIEIDYDHVHDFIDSINVTPGHIWAKVKMDNEWKELQKNIELQ